MDPNKTRYSLAILEEVVLAHLFETRALLNVLERKGLLAAGEVSSEIQQLKNVSTAVQNRSKGGSGAVRRTSSRAKRGQVNGADTQEGYSRENLPERTAGVGSRRAQPHSRREGSRLRMFAGPPETGT